jgi:hypothetical protein
MMVYKTRNHWVYERWTNSINPVTPFVVALGQKTAAAGVGVVIAADNSLTAVRLCVNWMDLHYSNELRAPTFQNRCFFRLLIYRLIHFTRKVFHRVQCRKCRAFKFNSTSGLLLHTVLYFTFRPSVFKGKLPQSRCIKLNKERIYFTSAHEILRLPNSTIFWDAMPFSPIECKIWGFHGGDYEEWCLLGCYAVWLL